MTLLAETLDLSRLPPFQLVPADFEAILAERLADLKARLAAVGIDWDVGGLESDPLVVLEQADAYRELLDLQSLNDAGRRLTLAFAPVEVLEHIAATYYADLGLRRLAGEDVERFRRRIMLAPEAKSAGTLGGYEYQALTADVRVKDARALNHATGVVQPGQIRLVVLPAAGAEAADVVDAVRARVLHRDVKLGSDDVSVVAAAPVVYDVTATIEVPPGPDKALVEAQALARLEIYAEERRRVGRVVASSGLDAALHVPAANRVIRTAPIGDVDPGPAGAAILGAVNLDVVNG